MFSDLIILSKLELTVFIIFPGHVHVELRLTRLPGLTLIVLFSLTALNEPSASQNCSQLVLSHSSQLLESESILL